MKLSNKLTAATGLILVILLQGCSKQDDGGISVIEMPEFQDSDLTAGRSVWKNTCRACHLMGVEGAPALSDFSQWETRLTKGEDALYQSVLKGIRGENGEYRMPPRGGNNRLTDEQLRLALAYKLASVQFLKEQSKKP